VRQLGIKSKRSYQAWTKGQQQKLLDLIASHCLEEVTMHRQPQIAESIGAGSRRHVLRRAPKTGEM
jgi:hypothetical protein